MFRTGICSISHRKLSIDEVIDLTVQCGLEGIEWGGDVHVPHGEIALAETVLKKTLAAGLLCPSYGSYYRVGVSEGEGLHFEDVLHTADALGVSVIRVWGGNRNRQDASCDYVATIAAETQRIAALAAARGISLAFEFHDGTLTNTPTGCRELVEAVARECVQTYWQPINGATEAENLESLNHVRPFIQNVHVFHWCSAVGPDGQPEIERRPLVEGVAPWTHYLDALSGTDREHWLYLEFAMNDDPAMSIQDAAVLKQLVE